MTRVNGQTRTALDDRSMLDLVRDLRDDATALLRNELKLLAVEMRDSAKSVARNGAVLVAGSTVLLLALQALVIAAAAGLTVGLSYLMPMNAAVIVGPLVVGVVLAIVGWATIQRGLHKIKHTDVVPRRSVDAIKETKQWLTEN